MHPLLCAARSVAPLRAKMAPTVAMAHLGVEEEAATLTRTLLQLYTAVWRFEEMPKTV